jgi:hypothetical protein
MGGKAMKRFVACFVVALAWMWAANTSVVAAPAKRPMNSGQNATRNAASNAPPAYAVIRVGDEVKIIPKSSLSQEKKNIANKFKTDMKAYQDAKSGKSKSPNRAAASKKPTKPVVTVIKASAKTREEAQKALDKYLEEHKELHGQATLAGQPKGPSTRGATPPVSARR